MSVTGWTVVPVPAHHSSDRDRKIDVCECDADAERKGGKHKVCRSPERGDSTRLGTGKLSGNWREMLLNALHNSYC